MFEIDQTRKHFVPKLYLRGFGLSSRPEQVYVFDKRNPEAGVTERSISNVEVSRDAYSVANDNVLKAREDQWSRILTDLRGSNVRELNELIADRENSASLRAWIARFVVDSKLRSRGFREEMREQVRGLHLQFRSEIEELEADSLAQHPHLRDQWQVMFPLFRKMAGIDNHRKFEALRIDPFLRGEEGEELYRWYEEGSWRFDAPTDGREFITSDIPSSSLLLGPEPQYRNWMWFVMPLSANLRLMGLCGDARVESGLAPRVGEMGDKEMDIANVCVFQAAQRFVYSSSKVEILQAQE